MKNTMMAPIFVSLSICLTPFYPCPNDGKRIIPSSLALFTASNVEVLLRLLVPPRYNCLENYSQASAND